MRRAVKNARRIVLAIVAAVVLFVAVWYGMGHRAPEGQPPLAALTPTTLHELQDEFNRSGDGSVRIILLLSPT